MTDRRRNGTWLPGHSPGRTRGARNRLAEAVFKDALAHWDEIEETSGKRKGQVALELLFRDRPGDYCRLMSGLLPKEFSTSAAELDLADDELDALLMDLHRRAVERSAIEQRTSVPMLTVKEPEG